MRHGRVVIILLLLVLLLVLVLGGGRDGGQKQYVLSAQGACSLGLSSVAVGLWRGWGALLRLRRPPAC